ALRAFTRPPNSAVSVNNVMIRAEIRSATVDRPMKRPSCWVFALLISLTGPTELLRCQPLETKADSWVDMLRNDARLQVAVNFKFASRPTSEQVLESLRKATGVSLSLVGQTDNGRVTLGITTAFNVPAWKLMQQLAVTQVTDGKWEQTGDGYVLHGEPKDFGMAVESPDGGKAIAAKRKGFEEACAEEVKANAAVAKFHPLGLDPKLRARLAVVEKHPKLSDVLARLGACSGLNFDLADNLTYHDPDLGVVTLPNVAAYSVMELITDKDLDNGRW